MRVEANDVCVPDLLWMGKWGERVSATVCQWGGEAQKEKEDRANQRTNSSSSTLVVNDRMYSETKGVLISSRCILDTMC